MNDYGRKITKAFQAILEVHRNASRLLLDCDGTIGKGRSSIFSNVVTRDVSATVNYPDAWMPCSLFRFYDAKDEMPGLIEGLTIYYWDDPPLCEEPLLIGGRIKYRQGSACEHWDLWSAFFKWQEDRSLDKVISVTRKPEEESRMDWFKLLAVPLFTIKSIQNVEELMARVR